MPMPKIEYLIIMLLCTACPRGHPYYVGEVSFHVTDLHSVVYTYRVTENFHWTLHTKKKNSPIPSYFCITEIFATLTIMEKFTISSTKAKKNHRIKFSRLQSRWRNWQKFYPGENFQLYSNNYYVEIIIIVIQCGRPVQELTCLTCGAPVGGVNHRLRADNVTART